MQLALFWTFSILMLVFALGVVFLRNPVSCAMSLVMTFVALAAVFVTLDAFFIAVVQVLVYAGAVMVLFLFIIMLLDLRSEKQRKVRPSAWLGGGLVIGGFVAAISQVVAAWPALHQSKPELADPSFNDVSGVGFTLFLNYNLPFQIIGVLLLVATVGVVLLSRKELK
ncbi:MAG: NADH-quinone oxidoreductase subunit J [Terrimicrobiaceae bacterium]